MLCFQDRNVKSRCFSVLMPSHPRFVILCVFVRHPQIDPIALLKLLINRTDVSLEDLEIYINILSQMTSTKLISCFPSNIMLQPAASLA